MSDLIDTTEMYLRTIYELEEEGITPLRARIAERLAQSGPTVSQTVQRMERDGLLLVASDRHIQLTESGRAKATSVMRKHRLAEVLLTQLIGLPLELAHDEACRWEHVISDAVEERLVTILDAPSRSPYGNPIPDPDAVGPGDPVVPVVPLSQVLPSSGPVEVVVERLAEVIQADPDLIALLCEAGVRPDATVIAEALPDRLRLGSAETHRTVDPDVAQYVFVRGG